MFGSKPKANMMSPLEKGDHHEIDESYLCDEEATIIIDHFTWNI